MLVELAESGGLPVKTIAYMALHYGKPYIQYAIRSVIDAVSEFHILYSDKPSHGYATNAVCPDTEDELHELAWSAAGTKLRWNKGTWQQENQQRNAITQYAPDADVVLVVDSDEVWRPETLEILRDYSIFSNSHILIPLFHFYHNFSHAMIHDLAAPPRILLPKAPPGVMVLGMDYAISHFGYCQPVEYLRYKLSCHGHKAELRFTPDEYVAMYLDRNRWTDLHPVGHQWEVAEKILPLDYMPAFMKEHPYFNLEYVE